MRLDHPESDEVAVARVLERRGGAWSMRERVSAIAS
jgi:hypothetical protein